MIHHGKGVAFYRMTKGYSQRSLCGPLKTTQQYLSKAELRPKLTPWFLKRVSDCLGIPVGQLENFDTNDHKPLSAVALDILKKIPAEHLEDLVRLVTAPGKHLRA